MDQDGDRRVPRCDGGHADERLVLMSKQTRKTFPVTVTRLPVVRCTVCGRSVANPRASAGDALTEHYRRTHPEILGPKQD
jgi:hypothetical protein